MIIQNFKIKMAAALSLLCFSLPAAAATADASSWQEMMMNKVNRLSKALDPEGFVEGAAAAADTSWQGRMMNKLNRLLETARVDPLVEEKAVAAAAIEKRDAILRLEELAHRISHKTKDGADRSCSPGIPCFVFDGRTMHRLYYSQASEEMARQSWGSRRVGEKYLASREVFFEKLAEKDTSELNEIYGNLTKIMGRLLNTYKY